MLRWIFGTKNKAGADEKKPNQDSSKIPQPLKASELALLNFNQRIKKCLDLFGNTKPLEEEGLYFFKYIEENGEKAPNYAYLYSFLSVKTNQSYNQKITLALAEALANKTYTQAITMLNTFSKLKTVHEEMIAAGKKGETTKQIEKILTLYQLPIENKEFLAVKHYLEEALEHLKLYIIMDGNLPLTTLSMRKQIRI